MMKKVILGIVLISLGITSCNKGYEKALKQNNKEALLNYANEFYKQGKYNKSILTFEKIIPEYRGTEQYKDILYTFANAEYKNEEYIRAATHFKRYHQTYRNDSLREKALYMSALSAYKSSPKYTLTQKSTYEAITEIQGFINTYPDSEYTGEMNTKIKEMRSKLERKAFEISKSYVKTRKYKAGVVSLNNMLNEYPDTKYKEEILSDLFSASYELAMNSVPDKKEIRLKNTQTVYKRFLKNYPESKYLKEINTKIEEINKELTKFATK